MIDEKNFPYESELSKKEWNEIIEILDFEDKLV